ncbi:hypothetical protein AP9108_14365 [Arthrospira sp. PCC 9108]|nr:hypothetical protein AP9108_14365 [Arthrospira sp. PCC 9108]
MSIPKIWQQFFFLGSLSFTVTVCTMAAAESPSYQQQPRNAYPQEFVSNYVSNCRERSQRSGLTPNKRKLSVSVPFLSIKIDFRLRSLWTSYSNFRKLDKPQMNWWM